MASLHLAILLVFLLATFQVVLAKLQDGKYLITPDRDNDSHSLPIGFDHGGAPVTPVIVGGRDHFWTIKKLEGKDELYKITSKTDGQIFTLRPNSNNKAVADSLPYPFSWRIRKVEKQLYTIEKPSSTWPTKALTVSKSDDRTPVELKSYNGGKPTPDLLWHFTLVGNAMNHIGEGCHQYPLTY